MLHIDRETHRPHASLLAVIELCQLTKDSPEIFSNVVETIDCVQICGRAHFPKISDILEQKVCSTRLF